MSFLFSLVLAAHATGGVFIMGVDGMDPVISDRMMAEGKLPNFEALATEGSYQRLGTSDPPQSPVAWSTFVTGMTPGGHGIFDFVHRDPATYKPISSAVPASEPISSIDFFGWTIPLSASDPKNNRGGVPFWDLLYDAGVDVEIFRIPGNFPSPPSDAKVLSGMGTVDLRGGYGTYTWYTSSPLERAHVKGDIQLVTLQDYDSDGVAETASGILRGPPDTFHMDPNATPGPGDYLDKRVDFHVDPKNDSVLIEVDDTKVLLAAGEWSDWVHISYDALPMGMMPVDGMVRFYVRALRPTLEIYASPVNIDPESAVMAVSSPEDWAEELAGDLGPFYTQGMPEETNALKDKVFNDDDYVKQVALVQDDTESMTELALSRFQPGDMTFMYFSDIDLQCHMLWRHGDPKYVGAPHHPAYEADVAPRHDHDIEGYYENVDRLLGIVRSRLPEGTMLIVMSDHGFQPYTRKVNLNAWLRDKGYLVMKEGHHTGTYLNGDVDWSKTRAYGIGFNGLYLNMKGREGQGVVEAADADALLAKIKTELEAFKDPKNGARVVYRADLAKDVYSGDRMSEGPDMIVGYDVQYGGSDETTLGEVPETWVEDNTSRWSGNHLMSPDVVPGILFTNTKLDSDGHNLLDLTVSILHHYGVDPAPGMVGTPFF